MRKKITSRSTQREYQRLIQPEATPEQPAERPIATKFKVERINSSKHLRSSNPPSSKAERRYSMPILHSESKGGRLARKDPQVAGNSSKRLTSSQPCSTPSKDKRRQSLPARRKISTRNVRQKEHKTVRRTRKQMQFAAAALNAFRPERRPQMLAMATLLPTWKDRVRTQWVSTQPDAIDTGFKRFSLIVNAEGAIAVDEENRESISDSMDPPAPRFSSKQKCQGHDQLGAAFLWQSLNDAGFDQEPPDFDDLPPNEEAPALSVD